MRSVRLDVKVNVAGVTRYGVTGDILQQSKLGTVLSVIAILDNIEFYCGGGRDDRRDVTAIAGLKAHAQGRMVTAQVNLNIL